jgi:NAD(P)-dependent dehydrogenase (short-subunit alcohol dehydrogenase family)
MLSSFPAPVTTCVFGASGGVGAAFVRFLADDPAVAVVHAGARTVVEGRGKVIPFHFDLTDEASMAEAAVAIGPLDLIIVATGMLHEGDLQPEKSYRAQSSEAFARAFALNATGPALIAKHFLPLLPRNQRGVFAALSARVSSVSDNRMGGWHAYRASKAALNMIVRNLAIELSRTHKETLAITLHPGTVATKLSAPFQHNVRPDKLFTSEYSAERLLSVIDQLSPSDSGQLFAWDGKPIPF